ncbi:MAG: HlyD family secretion protein [Planctomycetaceae bacterium]|nr:HlyD family secretion protein [Planctomycetaceae bacterium]
MIGVSLVAIGGLLSWWMRSRIAVSTDNVYVVGNITPISAGVSGTVVALYVDDNMVVQSGDPIAQIDPVPFQMHVDQALADLKQARAEADAADVTVRLTREDRKSLLEGALAKRSEAEQAVRAAKVVRQTSARVHEKEKELLASLKAQQPGLEALAANARDYYQRFNHLASSGDISIQERDNREANYREAMAKLESLKSNIAAAESQVLASGLELQEASVKLEESRRALETATATVGQAEAEQLRPNVATATALALRNKAAQAEEKLRLARLDLSNTLIRAPQAGIISRRTIQLGQTVEARRPFLSIVPLDLDNVWVVANLREDQMKRVRVGQPAVIRIDAIPERSFAGWVESVSGGTGSVFSLFPADNATGNFTRIVQRLPVRIRFTDKENYQNRIRPGMSAVVTIDTTRFVRQSVQEW